MKNHSLKKILLTLLVASLASCAGCSTINKAYWDHKVKEMCLKDAGVTVYERVGMSQGEFNKLRILARDMKDGDHKYYRKSNTTYINKSENMLIMKFEEEVIRNKDEKVLGKFVTYSRSGGDGFLNFSHPTQFGCWDIGIDPSLTKSIFYVEY